MSTVSRASRVSSSLACLATAAALAASTPAAAKGTDAAVAPSPDLLVTVALGPASTLRGLQAYVESVKPGLGAVMSDAIIRHQLASAVGVMSLDGLDASGWTYLLFSEHTGTGSATIVGKVRDAKVLTASVGADHLTIKNGWAVVGDRVNVDRDAAFAFGTLATQAAPKQPTATVYLPQVLARYQPQLSAARAQMTAGITQGGATPSPQLTAMMNGYADGLGSLGDDSDQVVITLDAAPDLASVDVALVPKAKSRLAAFVAAQKPTDYALLAKLPASQPSVLMAGRIDLGPYHDGLLAMMAMFLDPTGSKDVIAAMEQLRKTMTGEVAFSMQVEAGAGMQMTQVLGTSDAKASDKGLSGLLDLYKTARTIDVQGMKTTIQASATPTSYDGVTLRAYDMTADISKAAPAQRQIATAMGADKPRHVLVAAFDKLALVVSSRDSQGDAQKTIDTARGKGAPYAPNPAMKAQIDASRARKDSLSMIFDLGTVMATFLPNINLGNQPIVMSLGTTDKRAHIRFALPASTLRGIATMKP